MQRTTGEEGRERLILIFASFSVSVMVILFSLFSSPAMELFDSEHRTSLGTLAVLFLRFVDVDWLPWELPGTEGRHLLRRTTGERFMLRKVGVRGVKVADVRMQEGDCSEVEILPGGLGLLLTSVNRSAEFTRRELSLSFERDQRLRVFLVSLGT